MSGDAAPTDPRSAWRTLAAKIDARFAEVQARHATQMQCGAGCVSCCQSGLTVTALEAIAVVEAIEAMPRRQQSNLRQTSHTRIQSARCPLLDDQGRCSIYESRPIICRSHGLPLLQVTSADSTPELSCCILNFCDADIPEDAILDSGQLTTTVFVANQLLCSRLGISPTARFALADLLTQGRSLLPAALYTQLEQDRR
ncbi:MAG: YkgJ family cysteine cluster protein [Deltaproteobacteria bacterium]|nr:YkgJ family cysteine cluster protein [Deltaproteobacteria bacterium]